MILSSSFKLVVFIFPTLYPICSFFLPAHFTCQIASDIQIQKSGKFARAEKQLFMQSPGIDTSFDYWLWVDCTQNEMQALSAC